MNTAFVLFCLLVASLIGNGFLIYRLVWSDAEMYKQLLDRTESELKQLYKSRDEWVLLASRWKNAYEVKCADPTAHEHRMSE